MQIFVTQSEAIIDKAIHRLPLLDAAEMPAVVMKFPVDFQVR